MENKSPHKSIIKQEEQCPAKGAENQPQKKMVKRSKRLRAKAPKCTNKECCERKTRSNCVLSPTKDNKMLPYEGKKKTAPREVKSKRTRVSLRKYSNNNNNYTSTITSTTEPSENIIVEPDLPGIYQLTADDNLVLMHEFLHDFQYACIKESVQVFTPVTNNSVMTQCKLSSDTNVVSMLNIVKCRVYHEFPGCSSPMNFYLESDTESADSPSITESEVMETYIEMVDHDYVVEPVPEDLHATKVQMVLSPLIRHYGIDFYSSLYHIDAELDYQFFESLSD